MNHTIVAGSDLAAGSYTSNVTSTAAHFAVAPHYRGPAAFFVEFRFPQWRRDDYLLMPACAYDGNRFAAVRRAYPPMFTAEERGVDRSILITDVPRLSADGDHCIEVTTGDLSSSVVAVFSPGNRCAWLMRTEQGIGGRNFGITFSEHANGAVLRLSYPVLRRQWYRGNRVVDAAEEPLAVAGGERITIPFTVREFPCADVRELYRIVFEERDDARRTVEPVHADIAWSAAWQIQEDKYNRMNYRPNGGYYAVGTGESRFHDWQTGWVGGGMSSLPLLVDGNAQSRERAVSTLEFMAGVQAASGYFNGIVHEGVAYGDGFDFPGTEHLHLIRKSADALYFLIKQLIILNRRGGDAAAASVGRPVAVGSGAVFDPAPGAMLGAPTDAVSTAARRCAEAFVQTWKRFGQWGQFVDLQTGDIVVGGSTAAAMAPGALALAYQFFGNAEFLSVAEAGARAFFAQDICRGRTTGGPGEILQCPDSESAFALLESFVVLFEVTGRREWLDCAEAAAHQCASWVVDYNYTFPPHSEFGRLGIRTIGSVFANVQNKHSAPGICTLSGNALLKLYRATQNHAYLALMGDIARFVVTCLSRADRPIHSWDPQPTVLPAGFMCERVNTSDWEGPAKVGGVFNGSCWSEVSQMLAWTEIPGVYVVADKGIVETMDAVGAELTADGRLVLNNPFDYPIEVKVLVERTPALPTPLGVDYMRTFQRVHLAPSARVFVEVVAPEPQVF